MPLDTIWEPRRDPRSPQPVSGSYSELAEKLLERGEAWEKRQSQQGSSELGGALAASVAVDLTLWSSHLTY